MKVALIGNMNNMNFSLMRYLRDLNIEADLIIFKDDNAGANSHFKPKFDTIYLENWRKHIKYIKFNSWQAALYIPNFLLKKLFSDYDIFIGNGLSPAIFHKINQTLDIFYPYSTGIEFVGDGTRKNKKSYSILKRIVLFFLEKKMIKGLKKTRYCLNAELTLTKNTFDKIKVPFINLAVPCVYNKEKYNFFDNKLLNEILENISNYNYIFFSPISHMEYKDPNPMLKGFSIYLKRKNNSNSILLLIEYGKCIDETKAIISNLSINNNVVWLPQMQKKELMVFLKKSNFCFSEFQNRFWGLSGWEFMSQGVPFFHYYDISPETFQLEYGMSIPPFINTNNPDEICEHLIKYTENPEPYKQMGEELKNWFEKNGGIGLAKKWKDLIIKIYNDKNGIIK